MRLEQPIEKSWNPELSTQEDIRIVVPPMTGQMREPKCTSPQRFRKYDAIKIWHNFGKIVDIATILPKRLLSRRFYRYFSTILNLPQRREVSLLIYCHIHTLHP